MIVCLVNADLISLTDIIMLYVPSIIENIPVISGDGKMYNKAPKMPLKPYLAIIELTEKLSTNDLKKTIIIIIGNPIADKPRSHIDILYKRLDINEFLNTFIPLSKLTPFISLK